MPFRTNNKFCYEKVVLYLKTISFARDNRAKKEIESLVRSGVDVEVIVFCDDEAPTEYAGAEITRYVGLKKTAPANLALRAIGALCFSFFALRHARRARGATNRKTLHWVADPILFPLVIGLKRFDRGDVLWDHHELPPAWILRRGVMTGLFVRAYSSADIVVHANKSRMLYLEAKIDAKAERCAIINNYPKATDLSIEKPIDTLTAVVRNEKFVFLQNSLTDDRCGPSIFAAVKQTGLKIIHAGNASAQQRAKLEAEVGGVDQFCIFAGSLSLPEISWLLRYALCTIVCYKQTSANQIYCEPNRLYHAMGMGATIIAGNNPTMAEEIATYAAGISLTDDGTSVEGIAAALASAISSPSEKNRGKSSHKDWGACEGVIRSIIYSPD